MTTVVYKRLVPHSCENILLLINYHPEKLNHPSFFRVQKSLRIAIQTMQIRMFVKTRQKEWTENSVSLTGCKRLKYQYQCKSVSINCVGTLFTFGNTVFFVVSTVLNFVSTVFTSYIDWRNRFPFLGIDSDSLESIHVLSKSLKFGLCVLLLLSSIYYTFQ